MPPARKIMMTLLISILKVAALSGQTPLLLYPVSHEPESLKRVISSFAEVFSASI